ncbi:hypothetical protein CBP51_16765 [Cellvibrio mixtus]|uniref:Uncharacterized protein n=1 Tax=Cellvibrio mixtus TaxID=39650 RepID=A0A266Q4L9_9GAMM|nr:hypothetical protein [Cellvibrio mixtus]OZY84813.1 hypothetical protein CBP51_16765 [Cellvibrio mixtus]
MTISVTNCPMIFSTQLDWIELPITVLDANPDPLPLLQIYSAGLPLNAQMNIEAAGSIRIPRKRYPSFISFIGQKINETKVYIALNVDLFGAVVFNLYAVDESGSSGGGSDGDYRVAGTVKINSVAAQRDLVIISDNPSGREIVGEGESAGDGTFDLTYTGWDGAVFVVAVDNYGADFIASAPLNAGAVIHPTTPNGYVYVVTEAGTTGASEPAWITAGSVVSGSVTFAPREYYRPVGWGPQKGALVE